MKSAASSSYKTRYSDTCDCPYCGETQEDIDYRKEVNGEEVDCEYCGGKFRYDLEITYDFTCEPIDGEGPRDESGEVVEPKFNDPNQLNLFAETV